MKPDLIDTLVRDLKPVKPAGRQASLRLLITCLLATLLFAWLMRGNRMISGDPSQTVWSWLKLLPFALGAIACMTLATDQTIPGKPSRPGPHITLTLAILLLLGFTAAGFTNPDAQVLIPSAWGCVRSIITFAILPLTLILWFASQRAATQPALAGALAGAAAGLLGALAYGMSCRIDGLAFIGVWYTVAILVTTTLGYLLGARLLRW
ncbi:NrsF family protein [Mucisphaera sp.]|uniref:NrsF family protein n=1 Tax=Mucisphaera sp. TaxID=2913024 RepID=UPI003D1413A8